MASPMRLLLLQWLRHEDGQDMVEYALLLAFVVVCSAALFLYNSASVATIWGVTDNNLSAAVSVSS